MPPQSSKTLFVFGSISEDRCNRVTAMAIGASLGAAGFTATWFIDDPLATVSIPFFLLLGIGQMSCFAAAQALIGQEAPVKERGAVLGAFGLCGAAGIMLATGVGGWLFDTWMKAGPFIIVGFANAVIVLLALIVRAKSPGAMPTK